MKNLYKILIAAGVLFAMIPISTVANAIVDVEGDSSLSNVNNSFMKDESKKRLQAKKQINPYYAGKTSTDATPKKEVKFRGIWGFAGDNESDGYFGGKLLKRQRVMILKGLYTTENESKGKLFGILKKGYFNGRVINSDGEVSKITGLYKIDKKNQTINMHWLTSYKSGWAKARVVIFE